MVWIQHVSVRPGLSRLQLSTSRLSFAAELRLVTSPPLVVPCLSFAGNEVSAGLAPGPNRRFYRSREAERIVVRGAPHPEGSRTCQRDRRSPACSTVPTGSTLRS